MKFVISMAFCKSEEILPLARAAEDHGWDAITFSDHIVHPERITTAYPYTETGERRWEAFTEWPDPWVTIGACAAVTKRIRFTNNVFVLPIRNPFQVAKAVSTAAVLSNNRVTLTIGVGWSRDEYELMGQDFHTRGKRCDEMLEILPKLWSGEMVEHHGDFFTFPRVQLSPAPDKPPPIYIGGTSEAALRRAARLGDGYIGAGTAPDDVAPLLGRLQALRTEYGRGHLPFEAMLGIAAEPSAALYKGLADQGLESTVSPPFQFALGKRRSTLDEKKRYMERFAENIIHKL